MPTFVDALKERYCDSTDTLDVCVKPKDNKGFYFVGAEAVSPPQQLASLRAASLTDETITKAASIKGELRDLCPRLRRLTLRGSSLPSFEILKEILDETPSLEFLDLSDNRTVFDSFPAVPLLNDSYPSVKVLVLNNCDLKWSVISHFLCLLPNLRELHLEENNLDVIDCPCHPFFPRIEVLNVSKNKLSTWKFLPEKCSCLGSVTKLVLTGNAISNILGAESLATSVPLLRELSLNEMHFRDIHEKMDFWQLRRLSLLPNLTSLKISYTGHSKVEKGCEAVDLSHYRSLAIGQIPSLDLLNASTIRPKERMEAMRMYVNDVHRRTNAVGDEKTTIEGCVNKDEIFCHYERYREELRNSNMS